MRLWFTTAKAITAGTLIAMMCSAGMTGCTSESSTIKKLTPEEQKKVDDEMQKLHEKANKAKAPKK